MNAEICKYFISGALAFFCDILILYFCTEFLLLHYLLANAFGYSTGLIVSYLLNVNWVFSHRNFEKRWQEFTIFNAIILFGFVASEVLMALFVEGLGLHLLYAKVISGGLIAILSYASKKLILFSDPTVQENGN